MLLSAAGLIPGYLAAMATIELVGRKPLQMIGFVVLTILFCIIGFAWNHLSSNSLFALFCLCNFFSNFGPNTTTFIVPGEHFPTRYRATAHGVSAAAGKLGSIISQVIYNLLKDKGGEPNGWVNHVMQIYALFMSKTFFFYADSRLLGIVTTFFIPETKGRPLERGVPAGTSLN